MATNKPHKIIIHSTDVSYRDAWDQFRAVNAYHKEQDFPKSSLGYYVGYHVLITGGKSYKCRLDADAGAHCNQIVGGVSMNNQSLGICVGFDGDIEQMPESFYGLLKKQILDWQSTYGIEDKDVEFHRDYNLDKTCPGVLLDDAWLANLLERKPIDRVIKQKQILEKISLLQKLVSLYRQLLSAKQGR